MPKWVKPFITRLRNPWALKPKDEAGMSKADRAFQKTPCPLGQSFLLLSFFLVVFCLTAQRPIQAQADQETSFSQPQFTVIINQVRGQECCNPGGLSELQLQLSELQTSGLSATFAVRYDALIDPLFVPTLTKAQTQRHELSGLLEITPELAQASGVTYRGSVEKWYEAQNAFLIGYTPEERTRLIDHYMASFKKVFGTYPTSTTAWMIDAPSLKYLKEKYGVIAHQLTREQWGLDSYTLYGGPPHYPYLPSENWALIPDANASAMPVIVRQTITDPVWVYGDTTSSFTSQPNDYRLGQRGLSYFEHLFTQAHTQPTQAYTFALVGLENSMPTQDQEEYGRQLALISRWQNLDSRKVVTATQFAKWFDENAVKAQELQVIHGQAQDQDDEQVWIVSTSKYRARLRLSQGWFYISDLRLYDPLFNDPYATKPAENHGYWVVPFLLDSSRFGTGDESELRSLQHDTWVAAKLRRNNNSAIRSIITVASGQKIPSESIKLRKNGEVLQVTGAVAGDKNQVLAEFAPEFFSVLQPGLERQTVVPPQLRSLLQLMGDRLVWKDSGGQELWGLSWSWIDQTNVVFSPHVTNAELSTQRQARYPFLFPVLQPRPLHPQKSYVKVRNQFAMAGRNPVRLSVYPRDEFGYPVQVPGQLQVSTKPTVALAQVGEQDSKSGMIFVDLTHNVPGKIELKIANGEFGYQKNIYFVANCKAEWRSCLAHPQWFWWYARNWLGDWWRLQWPAWEEKLKSLL